MNSGERVRKPRLIWTKEEEASLAEAVGIETVHDVTIIGLCTYAHAESCMHA